MTLLKFLESDIVSDPSIDVRLAAWVLTQVPVTDSYRPHADKLKAEMVQLPEKHHDGELFTALQKQKSKRFQVLLDQLCEHVRVSNLLPLDLNDDADGWKLSAEPIQTSAV